MAGRMQQIIPMRSGTPRMHASAPLAKRRSTFWVDVMLMAIGASAVALLFFGAYYR